MIVSHTSCGEAASWIEAVMTLIWFVTRHAGGRRMNGIRWAPGGCFCAQCAASGSQRSHSLSACSTAESKLCRRTPSERRQAAVLRQQVPREALHQRGHKLGILAG